MRYKFELSIMIAVLFGLSLAGVASADSVVKTLYVDGQKIGTSTSTQAISFPYQRLTIGSEGNAWYRYQGLNGEIDEFAVYGYVLTDANVAAHYAAAPSGYQAAVSTDKPLLYLKFDNDPCSGNGYKATNSGTAPDMNITYIGNVTFDNSAYVGSKAAVFHGTGSTGDCIDVCDWSMQLSVTDVSVEFWVKTTQSSDYPRFFQHNGSNAEQHSYGAMYSAATNAVGLIGGGSTGYITKAINNGTWHHVVVTYNSIIPGPYAAEVLADDPCVYLKFDNVLPVDSSANNYWVGYNQFAWVVPVPGAIGGKAIYMDGTLKNSGHSDNDAFVWNNYYPTGVGRVRAAPPYGGNDSGYAFVPAPGAISFEIWIKSVPQLPPMSGGSTAMLFQQIGAYTREPNGPALGLYNDGGVTKLRIPAGSQWYYPGTVAPLDEQWHQLVVTYDPNSDGLGKSMGVQLYMDGSLAAQTTIIDPNGNAFLHDELSTLEIGAENDWGYPYNCYSGYVDEFAVYSGVLGADRVAAHYAAWQPKNCAEVMARGLTLAGDLNGDCQVDFEDFAILASQWHLCDNPSAGCPANW